MISAADKHDVGWPLPASLVERTESIRNCVAMFLSVARDVVMEACFPIIGAERRKRQKTSVSPRCCGPYRQKPVCGEHALSRRQRPHRLNRALSRTHEVLFT
jgi:hypothetical protein